MVSSNLFRTLGYAGLLPFSFGLLMMMFELTVLGITGITLFTSYSAIILSFLSGALWGRVIHLSEESFERPTILVFSNLFALLAWLGLLAGQGYITLWILLIGYLLVITVEHACLNTSEDSGGTVPQLASKPSEPPSMSGYAKMRIYLTGIVASLHVLGIAVWSAS
ncbi:DUF3429 domain-containing protein [Corallincola platygyrae]|uniref:DUF3429 domain-containing protein n=1 Tax=Corallincola platygyrae TaxID=1193278 RepID=A0ABW4XGI1_9GAMM